MSSPLARPLAPTLALALLAAAAAQAQPPAKPPQAWRGCCGLRPWAEPGPAASAGQSGGLFLRGYSGLVAGSNVRHHKALTGGTPAAYAAKRNPLAPTPENVQRGEQVYQAQCATCHGESGLGVGPGSRTLKPPPAQLGWLNKVAASRRDGFMYWTVVEGGAPVGTAMPAYKGKLSDPEIWSVIGYIQARLPAVKAQAR